MKIKGLSAGESAGGIEEFHLEANGLRILLAEDRSAPVVTVMVTYNVGGRNEVSGFTGLAHMLEHMLFKGTDVYHKRRGTQISMLLESAGAVLNANTGQDSTNYYEMIPSDKILLALDIEAARMRGSLIEPAEFEAEKAVVQNELERYYDSPEASLSLAMWKEAFSVHPYRLPVIGLREEVAGMPAVKLREFYDTYYWPNNATLTVAGDFEKDALLEMIVRKFSPLAASPAPIPSVKELEPPQTAPRRVVLEKESGAQFVMLAHKVPEGAHADAAALDVLSNILGQGKTSRLYRELVDSGLAVDAASGASASRDPGLFTTVLTLAPGTKHEKAEKGVREIYARIADKGVSESELDRARHQLLADAAYSRDGSFSTAQEIAHALAMGDWRLFARYAERIQAVTARAVQEAARHYLKDETSTTGFLVARSGKGTGSPGAGAGPAHDHGTGTAGAAEGVNEGALPQDIRDVLRKAPEAAAVFSSRIQEVRSSSFKMLTFRTGARDVVTVSGFLKGAGSFYDANPLAARLASHMLDKGTVRRSKHELAELLEERGAHLSFGVDHAHVRFHGRCLKKDAGFLLQMLAEQLRFPAFDEAEFQNLVRQETVNLQYSQASTGAMGFNAFTRAMFPAGHPHASVPFAEQLKWLEKTSVKDLKHFHEKHYAPRPLILACAGDLDPDALEKAAQTAFAGWEPRAPEAVKIPVPDFAMKPSREVVPVPGRIKMDVYLGHPLKLYRSDPDYLAMYMANYILGGDFSARLSNIVRDVYGLTYGIRSGIVGMTQEVHGAWMIHMIVNTPKLEAGLARTREVLDRFVREGISARELEERKKMVAGKFKVGLSTTQGLADQIRYTEELGLGRDYLDRFPALVQALTLDQVNQAIGRYYHPDRLKVIVAGQAS